MNESGTASNPITITAPDAAFLAGILHGLANVLEIDGPNRLTDEQLGLVAGAPGTLDAAMGVDSRRIAADTARRISAALRNVPAKG